MTLWKNADHMLQYRSSARPELSTLYYHIQLANIVTALTLPASVSTFISVGLPRPGQHSSYPWSDMAIASRSAAGGNLDIPEGYHGNLNPHQQKALDDLKKMLESKHGIVSEASPVATRHQVEIYADPELRYDLELL